MICLLFKIVWEKTNFDKQKHVLNVSFEKLCTFFIIFVATNSTQKFGNSHVLSLKNVPRHVFINKHVSYYDPKAQCETLSLKKCALFLIPMLNFCMSFYEKKIIFFLSDFQKLPGVFETSCMAHYASYKCPCFLKHELLRVIQE